MIANEPTSLLYTQSSGSSNCAQMSYEEPQSEPLAESSSAPAPLPAQARDEGPLPADYQYDFVERPPSDFFCPVTYELLLDPQQLTCCGHHFSREAAEHMKSSGIGRCPLCNQDKFEMSSDKYHKRRVTQVLVRCLHKKEGNCEWVGKLSDLSNHALNCPKQPWECPHCEFAGLKAVEHEHLGTFHS